MSLLELIETPFFGPLRRTSTPVAPDPPSITRVMQAVTTGSDVEVKSFPREHKGLTKGEEESVIEGIVQARVGREAVTYGMRTGEMEGILHGARWA